MKLKKTIIILENEIDLKTWLSLNKSYNSYNDVKFHLEQDKENPKIKHVIYTFNEDKKIIKENKGKVMKQSQFQESVLEIFSKISNRLEQIEDRLDKIEDRLDKIENRLDKLEDFAEKQSKFNEFILGEIAFLKKFHKDNL